MAKLWNDNLSVGVALIDEQHKGLFDQVERLLAACRQGKGGEAAAEVIRFLGDYVVSHFQAEERLMAGHGYPELAGHRALHQQFVTAFGELKAGFEARGAGVDLVVLTNRIVVEWLNEHIRQVDKKLGAFLSERQVV